MAFNFNWSPLTADEDFYQRARDLLTTALNKTPKPPIIVDDILVTELNLGSVPPELEILEIGDLAEDRFRGIFKMCYSGDAFLTLRTRVQVRVLAFCLLLLASCFLDVLQIKHAKGCCNPDIFRCDSSKTSPISRAIFLYSSIFMMKPSEGLSAEIVIIVKPDKCRVAIIITAYISEVASGSGRPGLTPMREMGTPSQPHSVAKRSPQCSEFSLAAASPRFCPSWMGPWGWR